MTSTTIQPGQTELCTVHHNGQSFSALGASVYRDNVTGYIKSDGKWRSRLTRWTGSTILACRSEIVRTYTVNEFGDVGHSAVFGLTRGRFVIGYSLGDGGLFRGRLIESSTWEEARTLANYEAESWIERDQEDAAEFDNELDGLDD